MCSICHNITLRDNKYTFCQLLVRRALGNTGLTTHLCQCSAWEPPSNKAPRGKKFVSKIIFAYSYIEPSNKYMNYLQIKKKHFSPHLPHTYKDSHHCVTSNK